ncbi:unnamed protein product [Schistocephalus solidus]|uniref:Ubiquitin-like domain-containing protein n=1 Tax=Schistocephalus solidus TaxID=70667 RepID=A0A183TFH0_SCHSO|nr:unnamed protein product [Schistocephalus solidus]
MEHTVDIVGLRQSNCRVCVGVSSFDEFSCLFGVSRGNHFDCVPDEAVVTVHGLRKHEGQRIPSADGQFMLIYSGTKLSTRIAFPARYLYLQVMAIPDEPALEPVVEEEEEDIESEEGCQPHHTRRAAHIAPTNATAAKSE